MDNQDSEKLGRLLEGMEQLRGDVREVKDDIKEERQVSRENRSVIHRRLDEQADEIGRLRADMMIAGSVEAQVRNELQALRDTVNANHNSIQPDIEEFRRMRTLGRGLFWLLGFGGISLGAAAAYMGESLAKIVRHWLNIP